MCEPASQLFADETNSRLATALNFPPAKSRSSLVESDYIALVLICSDSARDEIAQTHKMDESAPD